MSVASCAASAFVRFFARGGEVRLAVFEVAAQRGEFLAHCGRCVTLDLAVARD